MPLDPHSEKPGTGSPDDYTHDHPAEQPSDWGWHGEWGRSARVAGFVVIALLAVMITATHYNLSGMAWLLGVAFVLFVIIIWDSQRRKNAWRK